MKTSMYRLAAFMLFVFCSLAAFSQNIISGTIRNSADKQTLPAVSVVLKGTSLGTYTDERGNFKMSTTQSPPYTLVVTSVGFTSQEVAVSNPRDVQIDLVPFTELGVEVVVSASRVPERILESPVSIERVNFSSIRTSPSTGYYDMLKNIKGVDLTYSSLTYATPSTRGFNGSGNARFNQLVDGMDNQAPGLNFSVGSMIGVTELDVESMELLPGASSALYGSGGMNGTLLINSKSPFKYQGLSFEIKQGMMHADGKERPISPYYDWSLRWGKQINDKWAFKISTQYIQAKDWEAQDYSNLQRNNVFSSPKAGDRTSDPNYDGVNVFGDEVSANMYQFGQAYRFGVETNPLSMALAQAASGGATTSITAVTNGFLGNNPTPAQLGAYFTNVNNFVNRPNWGR